STHLTLDGFAVFDPLKVDADLVFFRRPRVGKRVTALASAVFSAELDNGLIPWRSQKAKGTGKARVRGESQLVQSLFNYFFGFRNAQLAQVDAAALYFCRLHLSHSVYARSGMPQVTFRTPGGQA